MKTDLTPGLAVPRVPDAYAGQFDRAWRQHTDAGNTAFDLGDHEAAAIKYQLALEEGERLFLVVEGGDHDFAAHVAPMLVVSAGNAARNELAFRRPDRSDQILLHVGCSFLRVLTTTPPLPVIGIHCLRNLPRLIMELTDPDYADAPGVGARQKLAADLVAVARRWDQGAAN